MSLLSLRINHPWLLSGPACEQCGRHTPAPDAPSGSGKKKKKAAKSEPTVSLVYYDQDIEGGGY